MLWLLAVLAVLGCLSISSKAAHNVTIENDTGDPTNGFQPIYEPAGVWAPSTFQPGLGDTNPDNISSTAEVTVTSTPVGNRGQLWWMTLLFNGTAVYVDFVLTSGTTDFTFLMDDVHSGGFGFDEALGFVVFNATVYANSNVTSIGTGPFGAHNLTISSMNTMSFDFAVYTVPDGDTSGATTTSSSATTSAGPSAVGTTNNVSGHNGVSTGVIVGAVIGAIAALCLLLALAALWIRSRRRSRQATALYTADPFKVERPASPLSTVPQLPNDVSTHSAEQSQDSPSSTGSITSTHPVSQSPRAETSAIREMQDKLEQMQQRLDAASGSSSRETRTQDASWLAEEVVALRAQVARLENQLQTALMIDEPPPRY